MKKLFVYILIYLLIFSPSVFALDVVPGLTTGMGTDTRAAYGNSTSPTIYVINTNTCSSAVSEDNDYNGTGITVRKGGLKTAIDEDVSNAIFLFEVGGYIDCDYSQIRIDADYVTIAGQTAPSPGVTLRDTQIWIRLAQDVLIQHIAVRIGDGVGGITPDNRDNILITDPNNTTSGESHNIVLDHVSVSWAVDENISIWQSIVGGGVVAPHDITIANSIIAEGLDGSTHPDGRHSKGLISGNHALNVAIVRNLFAHNYTRTPILYNGTTYVANNVMYNMKDYVVNAVPYYDALMDLSVIGNVSIKGPESTASTTEYILNLNTNNTAKTKRFYLLDNISVQDADGDASGDAWDGVQTNAYGEAWRVETDPLASSFVYDDSENVKASVLANAGFFPGGGRPDVVDSRYVADTTAENLGSYVDVIELVEGDCTAANTPMFCCTGLDTWNCATNTEGGYPVIANAGPTTLAIPANPHSDDDSDGYSNLEEMVHDYAKLVEGTSIDVQNVSPADNATGISTTASATWYNSPLVTSVDLWLDEGACDGTPVAGAELDDQNVETYDMSTLTINTIYCLTIMANYTGGPGDQVQYDFTTTGGPPAPVGSKTSISYSSGGGSITHDDSGITIE